MIFIMYRNFKIDFVFLDSYGLCCSDLLDCGCYASMLIEFINYMKKIVLKMY